MLKQNYIKFKANILWLLATYKETLAELQPKAPSNILWFYYNLQNSSGIEK